ncbi:AIR synthase related protein [Bdellovibrio bacteriovorus]|nr:AIR synthase-related protein [Bdellovibrio bacteriovorus]UXR66286.1 AIR synthase related protein [Bdellovibrio bacteriovorus]
MHGGDQGNAVAVSNGLCPQYSYYDTYLMAQKAVDEAVRNLVATGADPARMALVDNFCWPDPLEKVSNRDAHHKMAQLVRACEGLYQAAVTFRAPFVSGKDSMKNDFIGKTRGGETVKISVPPTLLVTAIGQVPDADKTAPGYFQNAGDQIYVLGNLTSSLYGSVLAQEFTVLPDTPEYPDLSRNLNLYQRIYQAHQKKLLESCHDISEGGLMSALGEAGFGNDLGMDLQLDSLQWNELWSETGSVFVVSVQAKNKDSFQTHFPEARYLGTVTPEPRMTWSFQQEKHDISLHQLHEIWSKGVLNVYEA